MMRLLLKTLSWGLGIVLALVVVITVLIMLDSRPHVPIGIPMTAAEHAWVKRWIALNRPSANRSNGINHISLTEQEADLLLNALLDKIAEGRAVLRLHDGNAQVTASLRLPLDQVRSYLNLELSLVEDGHLLRIESARIAGLPVPGSLIQALAKQAIGAVERAQVVQSLEIGEGEIHLSYAWRPNLLEHIGSGLVSEEDLPGVLRYQARLQALSAEHPRRRPIALAELLSALLGEAAADRDMDPAAANRAAILALAAYVNDRTIRDPGQAAPSRSSPRRIVTLRGRRDLSQHFMTSAALAVEGNDTLSSLVGWYKELSDSDGGSGFSFADMTANRAGIRFAKLATESRESALRIQRIARTGLKEGDFMPAIEGLPEGMSRSSFATSFGDPKTQAYKRMILTIDKRIDARPLFQPASG